MDQEKTTQPEQLSGQMSFLEHLDEFRRRLVKCVLVVIVAFIFCYRFSGDIFNFLEIPVLRAMSQTGNLQIPISGKTGDEKILPLNSLKVGDKGHYIFVTDAKLGVITVAAGTSVEAIVSTDTAGDIGLFTDGVIFTNHAVIPKGIRLPVEAVELLNVSVPTDSNPNERMTVTTATEPFTLYMTVSLYSAIGLALPFILLQVWGFISPALYKHERRYVTPFILLSSISFVVGAAFAYYILIPPALQYLLGLGSGFQLMLRATDYFEFITLVMLAMGLIFQMPAIVYVLARIGIVSAGFLIKSWKFAIVIILIVAAVVSPTGDIPNMMLFALPMMALYLLSIFVAWFFGKKRMLPTDDIMG
jgi:sec-independent protein translocase protein TatC